MASYSLDAEKFINEIKKHKELWDLDGNGKPYRIKMKEKAWFSVAKVFIQDFESMSNTEQCEVYRKLYNKWRNIRDAFVRNIRGTRHQTEYIFMKQLSFLNSRYKSVEQTKTEDKSSDDDDNRHDETIDQSCESEDEAPSVIENLKRRRVSRKRPKIEMVNTIQNTEYCDPVFVSQDVQENRHSNRQMVEMVDTPMHSSDFDSTITMSRLNEESGSDLISPRTFDEDRSFFDSLLPAVREFDMDQKLKFRFEVLKIIKDIRSNAQNSNCKPEPSSAYYLE